MTRRDLIKLGAIGALGLASLPSEAKRPKFESLLEFKPLGNLTLIFTSDFHGHLSPLYFAEPMNLLAPEPLKGTPGYLAGTDFLNYY
ncbi:MAG: thiosulfohydrolase SoxB, partial [Aquificaceae bacterium]|nr:thiosulfohydrolase SoxB [Aquificaceae bacterium]